MTYLDLNKAAPNTEGNYTKTVIDIVNNSKINMGAIYWVDSVYTSTFSANATNMTWHQVTNRTFACFYNSTNATWLAMASTGMFSMGSVYISNITAINITVWAGLVMFYPVNNSGASGTILTYWNGKTDGTGVDNNSIKVVVTIDSSKYVVMGQKSYNWTTNNNSWTLQTDMYATSASWWTTAPPIPGFEIAFIALALGGIMAFFLWRKKQINIIN